MRFLSGLLLLGASGLPFTVSLAHGACQTFDTAVAPSTSFPNLGSVDWTGWENIADLLSSVREATGIPALAAAVVKDGKIVDHATVGVRVFGSPEAVRADDRFHLGSVTKSITATVIGKLVEDGQLTWGTTLGQGLPGVQMREAYRGVTLEQLLQHRGGVSSYTNAPPGPPGRLRQYTGTPTEKRAAFLADVLQEAPVGRPGETMQYSNAGYALAGHVAERVTGESWEDLVIRHIFTPLGMTKSGFGFPGTAALPDQPCGHDGRGPKFTPLPDAFHPPLEIIAPAGNIHCSVRDLARYAIFHLEGLSGRDGYLRSETIKRLHTPPQNAAEMPYAAGWRLQTGGDGEEVHFHGGTAGSSYAEIKLLPADRAGVVVLMNVGRSIGEPVVNKLERAILNRYRPKTPTVAAAATDSKGFQFKAAKPREMQPTMMDGEPSPEDDLRFWRVIKILSESINDEDRKSYRALFSKARSDGILSKGSAFDFMARMVMPTRGSIESFHALSRPIRLSDSKYPVRTLTFHMENGYPGYFGISLDDDNKIDHFSLFVKPDLCPNGADPTCDKIAKTLAKDFKP